MSDAVLQIKIGADVKDAISGMGQTGSAATAMGTTVKAAGEQFDVLNSRLNLSAGYMKQQADAAKALASAESQLAVSTREVAYSTDGVSQSGAQFLGKISQQRVALVDLGRIVTGTGFTIRSLGSQLQLFSLPVVIAVAALALLAKGLLSQTDAEKKAAEAAKELQDAVSKLKSVGDIIGQATGSQAGDIDRVKALAAAVRDSNLSYAERKRALEELKETNKAYFGDLTLEASSLATLSKKVTDYSNALIQEAIVKGLSDEISKTTEEYNKQNDILVKLKTNMDNATKAQKEFKPVTGITGGATGSIGGSNDAEAEALLALSTSKATAAFLKQRDGVESLSTAIAQYHGQIEKSVEAQLKIPILKDPKDTSQTQSETLSFLEQTKKNLEDIQKVDPSPIFKKFEESAQGAFGQLNTEILKDKISKAISDGTKDGVSKNNIDALVNSMQAIGDKIAKPDLSSTIDTRISINPILQKDLTTYEAVLPAQLDELLGKLPPLKTDIKVDPNFIIINDQGQTAKQFAEEVEKLLKSIQSSVSSAISKTVETLGTAIGGGGFDHILTSLGSILGEVLKSIGEAFVTAATAVLIAKDVFSKWITANPLLAIGAGLALEVAGSLIVSAVSKKPHAFAEGGIVTGPIMGLIGEAGPEAIMPLSKLQQFVKGNTSGSGQDVNVRGEISGQNLRLVLARANKNQALV